MICQASQDLVACFNMSRFQCSIIIIQILLMLGIKCAKARWTNWNKQKLTARKFKTCIINGTSLVFSTVSLTLQDNPKIKLQCVKSTQSKHRLKFNTIMATHSLITFNTRTSFGTMFLFSQNGNHIGQNSILSFKFSFKTRCSLAFKRTFSMV